MLVISAQLSLPESECDIQAIRAQGAGGQNVNKVSTAIHLRFDIRASSLPENYKHQLLEWKDQRISKDGVIIIKAQRYRSQDKNRQEALERLVALIRSAMFKHKKRRVTRPTRSSQRKRMDKKTNHGRTKALRGKVDY